MLTKRAHKVVYDYKSMRLGHILAVCFHKKDGAGFSGWVVSNDLDQYHYTDSISTRAEALRSMKAMYDETYNDYVRSTT